MLRAEEPGWVLVTGTDSSRRRGVWFRRDGAALEICAGREGDDDYVRLDDVSPAQETALRHVVMCAYFVGTI